MDEATAKRWETHAFIYDPEAPRAVQPTGTCTRRPGTCRALGGGARWIRAGVDCWRARWRRRGGGLVIRR